MAFARKLFEDFDRVGWRVHECTDVSTAGGGAGNAETHVLEMSKVKVHAVMLKNNTTNADLFFKMYNGTDITLGTTDPELILPSVVDEQYAILFPNGLEDCFTDGITIAAVDAKGTAGSDPASTGTLDAWVAVEDDV